MNCVVFYVNMILRFFVVQLYIFEYFQWGLFVILLLFFYDVNKVFSMVSEGFIVFLKILE